MTTILTIILIVAILYFTGDTVRYWLRRVFKQDDLND